MERKDLGKNVEKLTGSRSKLAQELENAAAKEASLVAQQNEDYLNIGESAVVNELATARARAEALKDAIKYADGELSKARFALDEFDRQAVAAEVGALYRQCLGQLKHLKGTIDALKTEANQAEAMIRKVYERGGDKLNQDRQILLSKSGSVMDALMNELTEAGTQINNLKIDQQL